MSGSIRRMRAARPSLKKRRRSHWIRISTTGVRSLARNHRTLSARFDLLPALPSASLSFCWVDGFLPAWSFLAYHVVEGCDLKREHEDNDEFMQRLETLVLRARADFDAARLDFQRYGGTVEADPEVAARAAALAEQRHLIGIQHELRAEADRQDALMAGRLAASKSMLRKIRLQAGKAFQEKEAEAPEDLCVASPSIGVVVFLSPLHCSSAS